MDGEPNRTLRVVEVLGLAALGLAVTLFFNAGCRGEEAAAAPATPTVTAPVPPPAPSVAERWGVELLGLRSTAGGSLLDLRYRVLDADKAAPLMRHEAPIYVEDPASGLRLMVPAPAYVGPLRQVDPVPREGRVYFAMFANPEHRVRPGTEVTLVMGDARVERVAVE